MSKIDVDCTKRCRSRSHGQDLTSAITKRSISDKALACFIRATCANFAKAFDYEGRLALHMAASRGRNKLMEWLMRHSSEAFINARDRESGYTLLHRSIFYGQIHTSVALMRMGINTEILDKDDYKALDHSTLDRHYMYTHAGKRPCDVYVWGMNSNYTLATDTQQQRHSPDVLACFAHSGRTVEQVCLGKFHSIFVCTGITEGEVWCCGQLARAGGPHATALRPVLLRLPEPCLSVAITLNSTVFLLQSGTIIQYTLNADSISPSTTKNQSTIKLPSTKPLLKISNPLGVAAGRFHSVVWNSHAVYTWGSNLGQLGHQLDEKVIVAPKSVSMHTKEDVLMQLVAATDGATVITNSRGDVYLLHKYLCKKIAMKQINLRQVCVEAKVSEQGVYSRVTVLLLTNVGQLLLWQDTTNRVTRCVFGLVHQTIITHVSLTHDAVYFTTKYGEAFIGHISRKTTPLAQQPIRKEKERDNNKSALVKFLEKDDCTSVRISRIPNVHRAVEITCDGEGLNFACLQIKPTCGLTSLPELSPSCMSKHMETLFETASDDDLLHDVIFKVGHRLYPAHVYIIASSSEYLYQLYKNNIPNAGHKPTIILDNVHNEVFERILRYMYTGSCDVAELGPCGLKIKREDLPAMGKKETDVAEKDNDEEIENPTEISAFEAYKSKDKNKKGRTRRTIDNPVRTNLYCDPVKLVQSTAKRLQVMGLHKLLEKFYYRDGKIQLKDSATFSKNVPPFYNNTEYPDLVDTNVCSKDGVLIPTHKCVLAARLEYFNGMFMHSWTESKLLSTVTLPINHGILQPIIDFLYTDTCPEIQNSNSIDFIYSMLIVSDQLFITRLREMCEVSLANLITLKNCTELCQFAHTYNATQLKQSCMEFISLNISAIFENKTLDSLDEDLLQDITAYYCKFNPIMSSRVITPFFNAPSDEFIEDLAKRYPVNLDYTDEEFKKDEIVETAKTKKRNKNKIDYTENEKARMRYESVSSVTSLDLSNETGDITLSLSKITKETESKTKKEKWIEVPSSQNKQQKVVQARLKAISNAKDILNESPVETFTKLTKTNHNTSQEVTPTTSWMSVSPNESPLADMMRSPQGNLTISHVGPKLSQKQRKKLASQSEDGSKSFNQLFANVNVSSPSDKPKNPWKICEPPIATSSPAKKAMEFNQILADQKKQKDDSSRIMTKPLIMTQLEDKAIEDLERFYNVHAIDDEWITVRRIEVKVSSPQWIHTAPK